MQKYKFTNETQQYFGRTLHRIVATRNFGTVKKGDLGGFIENEGNLSHFGDCWVFGDARVYGALGSLITLGSVGTLGIFS
jgi:hypothetical protein